MCTPGSRRPRAAQPLSAAPTVAASILSTDLTRLARDVSGAMRAGAAWVHVDVMDDHAPSVLTAWTAERSGRETLDVHLLVKPTEGLVRALVGAGADLVTFHSEATENVRGTVALVKDLGCRVGLALHAATPLRDLGDELGELDLIVLVSPEPGFGGRAACHATLARLRALRERISATGRRIGVEVDGGVRPENVRALASAGADVLVAGPALARPCDFAASLAALEGRPARGVVREAVA